MSAFEIKVIHEIQLSESTMSLFLSLLGGQPKEPTAPKGSTKIDFAAKAEAKKAARAATTPGTAVQDDQKQNVISEPEKNQTNESTDDAPAVDFTTLRAEFVAKAQKGKTPELQNILKGFDIKMLTELKPEQYAEAYQLVMEV